MKTLNSGHLRFLKNVSIIGRCLLLGGNLTKIVLFVTNRFVHYPIHVRYLGCPLLGGFTVLTKSDISEDINMEIKTEFVLIVVEHAK